MLSVLGVDVSIGGGTMRTREEIQTQTIEQWYEDYDNATAIKPGESKMDMTKYAQTDSNDLKAKNFIGKRLKLVISKVDTVHYEADKDNPASDRGVLYFEGKEKRVVLNATNTETLCTAYGYESDGWTGHEIELTVADYTSKNFGYGWVVRPLDVKEADFDSEIDF